MQAQKEIAFGAFRVDRTNEYLWQGTRAISLRPKAFALLKLLLENPNFLVTKRQMLEAVWPGIFVGDAVLKDSIRQLREALDVAPALSLKACAGFYQETRSYPALLRLNTCWAPIAGYD